MSLFDFQFRNIISTFEKEREQTKKTIEQAKKYADGLIRERDLVRKELVKCNSKCRKGLESTPLMDVLKLRNQSISNRDSQ
jgi:hypothetical protein